MASMRMKRIHGQGGVKQAAGDVQNRGKADSGDNDGALPKDTSPEAEAERARICRDFKYFYDNYIAATVRNPVTKEMQKQTLGQFHYLMLDYQNLDILDEVENYSNLWLYLPDKDENGDYKEKWLYYRTLDSVPEQQDGPVGPISQRFYNEFWQGVMIRICGDGRTKCTLAPRNHLKSTICGTYKVLWRTLRDHSERNAIRCVKGDLAKKFLKPIPNHFDNNEAFRKLYGHLIGQKRKDPWNTEMIQYAIPPKERRGVDPTIQTGGAESDMTGTHWDAGILDDIVAASNSGTPHLLEGTRQLVADMHNQRDHGSRLDINGTRWHNDDAYSPIVGEPGVNEWSGSLAPESCFFVATVLDGDESVPVPPLDNGLQVTPLGYGKPIWPEGFDMRRIISKRRGDTNDYHFRGQYFNQFIGTSNCVFKRDWITNIETVYPKFKGWATPRIARELKLNIFAAADTAGGKSDQTGKVDKTAMFVGGQTPDRKEFYFLDGFCEKLPAERIAYGIIRTAIKWKNIADDYGGTFKVGFEKTRYTEFLSVVLAEECRKQEFSFSFDELAHGNRAKVDRITVMAQPYSEGRILWPEVLMVDPVKQSANATQEPYDLRLALQGEFINYNAKATEDNLIDAHAYAWEISFPGLWKAPDVKPQPVLMPWQYSRAEKAKQMYEFAMGDHGEPVGGMGI